MREKLQTLSLVVLREFARIKNQRNYSDAQGRAD